MKAAVSSESAAFRFITQVNTQPCVYINIKLLIFEYCLKDHLSVILQLKKGVKNQIATIWDNLLKTSKITTKYKNYNEKKITYVYFNDCL